MLVCSLQVSVSCGIPDFRSRDGIYARLAVDFPDLPDPQAMFDIEYFRRDPRPFFKFAKVCTFYAFFLVQASTWFIWLHLNLYLKWSISDTYSLGNHAWYKIL